MKTYLTKAIASAIVITLFFNCSIESIDNSVNALNVNQSELDDSTPVDPCIGQDPKARLTNNGSVIFDIEIYSLDGVLLNHEYSIAPGETTAWKPFVSGETMFSVSNSVVADEKVVYTMGTCMEFDMEIGADNKLTAAVPVQF